MRPIHGHAILVRHWLPDMASSDSVLILEIEHNLRQFIKNGPESEQYKPNQCHRSNL